MSSGITYCSANTDTCPMTNACKRAEWRRDKPYPWIQQSYADFSEELVRQDSRVTCPFYLEEKK